MSRVLCLLGYHATFTVRDCRTCCRCRVSWFYSHGDWRRVNA